MRTQYKCALTVCACLTKAAGAYCCDYCKEAATHATERNFCQCSHAGCVEIGRASVPDSKRPPASEVVPEMAKAKRA
jgi:hypothetical protein